MYALLNKPKSNLLLPSTARGENSSSRHALPAPQERLPKEALGEFPSSRLFSALLSAYRDSGGTARADDVTRLLKAHGAHSSSTLAEQINSGELFGFDWRGRLWIPMFQFDPNTLSLRHSTALVLTELGDTFDGWARANWFAQPNCWLASRKPVDLLESDLAEVLNAARTDRFIAVG